MIVLRPVSAIHQSCARHPAAARTHIAATPPRCQSRDERAPFSLDDLVGAGEERGRDGEAKRPGSGLIDDEIKLSWLFNGKSAGFAPRKILST